MQDQMPLSDDAPDNADGDDFLAGNESLTGGSGSASARMDRAESLLQDRRVQAFLGALADGESNGRYNALVGGGHFRIIRAIRMCMFKNTTARPRERTSSTIQPGASGQRCLGLTIFAAFPGSSGGGHAQPVRRHPENLFG